MKPSTDRRQPAYRPRFHVCLLLLQSSLPPPTPLRPSTRARTTSYLRLRLHPYLTFQKAHRRSCHMSRCTAASTAALPSSLLRLPGPGKGPPCRRSPHSLRGRQRPPANKIRVLHAKQPHRECARGRPASSGRQRATSVAASHFTMQARQKSAFGRGRPLSLSRYRWRRRPRHQWSEGRKHAAIREPASFSRSIGRSVERADGPLPS